MYLQSGDRLAGRQAGGRMALSCRQVHLGVNGPKKQVSVQETEVWFFFSPWSYVCRHKLPTLFATRCACCGSQENSDCSRASAGSRSRLSVHVVQAERKRAWSYRLLVRLSSPSVCIMWWVLRYGWIKGKFWSARLNWMNGANKDKWAL